jgi:hypothetical protein
LAPFLAPGDVRSDTLGGWCCGGGEVDGQTGINRTRREGYKSPAWLTCCVVDVGGA